MLAYGTLAEAVGTEQADAALDGEVLEFAEPEALPRSAVLADPGAFGGEVSLG